MPKGKLLTDDEKGQIKAYKKLELFNRHISRIIGGSPNCIHKFVKEQKIVAPKKRTPGPKYKLYRRDESRILRESIVDETTIAKIKSNLQLNVSRETVRRVLKRSPNVSFVNLSQQIKAANVCQGSSNLEF